LDEEEAIVGEDSRKRAVVRKCDQHDQRPTCRSGPTKGERAVSNYNERTEELSEK